MQRVLIIVFLAVLTIAVRLIWLGMVPMAEAPDENTHLWVIRFLGTFLRLPTGQEVLAAGPVGVYGSIPQFGYVPHLVVLKVLPSLSEIIAGRVGSLFMAVVAVILARLVAIRIFAGRPLLQWALPLMLVFHPQFVFVGSYTNNDSTTCALASAILLLIIISLRSGLCYWRTVAIGVLSGWIALTKYSGYAIFPCIGVFLPVAGLLHGARIKQMIFHLIVASGLAGALSGWWFVRNYYEFHGDVAGSRTLFQTWTNAYHRKVDAAGSVYGVLTQNRWWRMNFFSFWGWFGYMTRSLPRAVYYGYLGFVLLAASGGAKAWHWLQTGRTSGSVKFAEHPDDVTDARVEFATWALLWTCFAANFAADVYGTASGVSGPQGRYFFTSEIPLMALLISGLFNLHDAAGPYLVWALVIFNAACYVYSTYYLYSLYGFAALLGQ